MNHSAGGKPSIVTTRSSTPTSSTTENNRLPRTAARTEPACGRRPNQGESNTGNLTLDVRRTEITAGARRRRREPPDRPVSYAVVGDEPRRGGVGGEKRIADPSGDDPE
ncbi:hypothetical protein GCM10010182_40470 [Actinomadura cremea]|nr:hypothetical protein GCM10010182_40470 [Actinomadura cremea]